jgi:hypothetical protein
MPSGKDHSSRKVATMSATRTRRSSNAGSSRCRTRGYRSLEENQRVEFDVTQGPKGPQATGVRAV